MPISVRQVQIQMISIFKYAHKYNEFLLCIYEAICNSNMAQKKKCSIILDTLLHARAHARTHTKYPSYIHTNELQGRKIIFSFKTAHFSIWHSTNLVLLLTMRASSCLFKTSILKQEFFLKYTLTIYII
jgi:hypothetical protein